MKKLNRVGEKYMTNEGCNIEITEYQNAKNCTIRFEDGYVKSSVHFSDIKNGRIKNPYHKSISNIGFIGEGIFTVNLLGKTTNYYSVWRNMIERCYNIEYNIKYPTYMGCLVVEEWHNFQNFAQWFYENYNPEIMEGWHLDKDILVKGNKLYSPETCCFVPHEINGIFTDRKIKRDNIPCGVHKHRNKFQVKMNFYGKYTRIGAFYTPEEAFQAYKTAKEKYIKEVADKWKNKIDPRVYQAMYDYQVEINN
mgnify:CR=1 FL=1